MKKKRIKRKPGQKSVLYFDKNTEVAITAFLQATGSRDREVLYATTIKPAIMKLSESLVYVYGFKSPLMSAAELIEECSFSLYNSLHKWDPDKGSKAFSYFNVVAKNFLINTTNGHRKKYYKHVYLNDTDHLNRDTQKQISEYIELPSTEELMIRREKRFEQVARVKSIRNQLSDARDLATMGAVERLFDSVEELDFINKQSIYVYLTEISGLEKKVVTKSMSKIRKIYAQILAEEAKDEANEYRKDRKLTGK
jgi:hypothetical protein